MAALTAEQAAVQVQVSLKFIVVFNQCFLWSLFFHFLSLFNFQERLKALYHLVHEIHQERRRSEQNLNSIEKAHENISVEEKVTPYYQVWFCLSFAVLNKTLIPQGAVNRF